MAFGSGNPRPSGNSAGNLEATDACRTGGARAQCGRPIATSPSWALAVGGRYESSPLSATWPTPGARAKPIIRLPSTQHADIVRAALGRPVQDRSARSREKEHDMSTRVRVLTASCLAASAALVAAFTVLPVSQAGAVTPHAVTTGQPCKIAQPVPGVIPQLPPTSWISGTTVN